MKILDTLTWRGLVQDVSDPAALKRLAPGDRFYVGFDPTAPSLQVGNLVPLLTAMRLGELGLKPLILFGGATGAIGDPSGKSIERPLLSYEDLEKNVAIQKRQAEAIYKRVGVTVEFVNNLDWTKDISVIEFLRDIGKHFTVNYMLAKEVVKARLDGEGISYTEFSYMILQALDFLHLYQSKQCKMQIGGSDQWGNITAGLELIRRRIQGDAVAFSIPLVTDTQGRKFGKSEGNAVWLDPALTSPYRFHQFWLNTADSEVIKCLKIFTRFTQDQIAELERSFKQEPEKRVAQIALADAVCELVHGLEATKDAKRSAEVLFGGSLSGLSVSQLEEIFAEVPSTELAQSALQGLSFIDLLAQTKLATSKGEARKLVANGGAYLNNERVSDANLKLADVKPLGGNIILLRAGKKNYHLIKVSCSA